MAVIKSNPIVKTVGVDPHIAYASLALLVVGVLICVLDQVGVIDVGDELWIGIIGSALGGLGIGAAAPAALQEPKLPVSAHSSTTVPDPGKKTGW